MTVVSMYGNVHVWSSNLVLLQYRFIVMIACDVLQFTWQVMWCIYLNEQLLTRGYCYKLLLQVIVITYIIIILLILTKRNFMLSMHLIRTGRG